MKTFDAATIYELLPVEVRIRDEAQGSALRALIGVIASQANIVDDNLYQLYDDLFIETCGPWVIPYIGDLIGYRPLRPIPPGTGATRADVAATIGLRRRKGTLAMLDQLARDVTGWPSVAVEFFARLAVSQYVRNHVRKQDACVDVHAFETASDINSAFDLAPRTVDVRRIQSGRGRYNIPNIGLFVWRLAAFGGATLGLGPAAVPVANRLIASTARELGPNMYTFDPFGDDVALVNPPQSLPEFSLPLRANVPYRLRRFSLFDELEQMRAGTVAPDAAVFFGATPVLAIFDGSGGAISPQHVAVCDLSMWQMPADPGIYVAVDPQLGRITFNLATFTPPSPLRVAYAYVFSGAFGGGTYARTPDAAEGPVTQTVADLATATPDAWTGGVVEIADSGLFLGNVRLAPAGSLVVRAADEARPVIAGNLAVVAQPGGRLTLRGLGIGGRIVVVPQAAGPASSSHSSSSTSTLQHAAVGDDPSFTLILEHCTVRGSTNWTYPGGGTLRIDRSLCGALFIDPTVDVTISASAIDASTVPQPSGGSSAMSAPSGIGAGIDAAAAIAGADGWTDCGNLTITASTVFGDVLVRDVVLIENSIITGTVSAARTQAGCIRYSYLPPPPLSRVPPRFRCQPDLAIDTAVAAARRANPALSAVEAQAIAASIEEWLVPVFTSRRRWDGGYAQLAESCSSEIATGAESGDEMGIFHGLYTPRRESNLRFRLDEYLRLGLEAGIIHAS